MTTTHSFVDRFVQNGAVSLATRDHGGSGQPIVLIHGACRNLEDFSAIVPYLAPEHRVVAMDMRSHGRSDEGRWEWQGVLGDVHAVISAYGLSAPVIVGHSLGGMIAAMYAKARDDCAAAVNIDGHAAGSEPRLLGLDPQQVRERWEEVSRLNVRILPGGGEPIDEEELPVVRQAMVDLWSELGVPQEVELTALDR
jgi:pimeloyl-ACP methyl ester carboxylesterase